MEGAFSQEVHQTNGNNGAMGAVADRIESLARWVLVLTVLVAPWLLGGYRLVDQRWLFAGVLASYLAWWVAALLRGGKARLVLPVPVMAAALFLVLGVVQLVPLNRWQPSFQHSVFADWIPEPAGGPVSIEPAMTRLVLIRFGFAFLTAVLAAQLFSAHSNRYLLWGLLAANGALLSLFGLAQRLSWNGQVYWCIPLRFGGQPFASYVNRNNAAGYLTFCLAAGLGALACVAVSRRSHRLLGLRLRGRVAPATVRSWSNTELSLVVLTAGCVLGICASFSRGGILAGCTVLTLGLAMLRTITGRRTWAYAAAILALPLAGLIWLNLDGVFQKRLESVASLKEIGGDARWVHWRDTVRAVLDCPLGSGLGTYRYANRPYQAHAARAWYYNADNQYLEVLIEMGPLGVLVVLLGVAALLRFLVAAWKDRSTDLRDVAIVLASVVLAQVQTSITDYGLIMPANLLTFGLVVGGALAVVSPRSLNVHAPSVRGFAAILIGALMISLPVTGLAEVVTAADQRAFLDRLPDLDHPVQRVRLERVEALLREGEHLSDRRPDNAELQLALADLWIYRFRLHASEELAALAPSLTPGEAWEFSSPANLLRQTMEILRTGGPGELSTLRRSRATVENLVPAWSRLQQAQAACRYVPRTHFLMGCLSVLMAQDERAALNHLKQEVALSPFDAHQLVAAGITIQQLGDRQTAFSLWKRSLMQNPELSRRIFQSALAHIDNSELLAYGLPDSVPVLLEFAERTVSRSARKQAIARLGKLLDSETVNSSSSHWVRGRMAILEDRWEQAIAHYERAVAADPFRVEYRIDLAAALEHEQRWEEAIQQMIRCQNDAPHRKNLVEAVKRLYRKQAELRPNPAIPNSPDTDSTIPDPTRSTSIADPPDRDAG